MNTIKKQEIYLAGGCFWGIEAYFRQLPGVLGTEVGYANGREKQANYQTVAATGHAETLRLSYDANRLSLAEILAHFFRLIDPTSLNRQGNDVGTQYRTGIYYVVPGNRRVIDATMDWQRSRFPRPLCVETEPLRHFIPAEDCHQQYLLKNPGGYCHINRLLAKEPLVDLSRFHSQDDAELRRVLTPLQYEVIRHADTEAPFTSEYEKETGDGLYVDIASGEPLFSSVDKFDAGCGWPSFAKTILPNVTLCLEDRSWGRTRTEVRSRSAGSHLGHVFQDGPSELGGLRYCINGAALRFIPRAQMAAAGYAEFIPYVINPD